MLNEELMQRYGSRLNGFTRALRDECLTRGEVLVRMRGGDWCALRYVPPETADEHPYDDCPEGGFCSTDGQRYWQANGKSITGSDFDIVEFKPATPPTGEALQANGGTAATSHAVLNMLNNLDSYLREIRAENLDGSEPALGKMLEESLTLRLALEGIGGAVVEHKPRAWMYETENPGFITDPVLAAKWKGPVALTPLYKGIPFDVIEHIAQQWDGCVYDAAGGCTIDIGQAIRQAYVSACMP